MAKPRKSLLDAAERAKIVSPETAAGEALQSSPTAKHVLTERTTVLNDIASGRRREVTIQSVEPGRCRMWVRHNRLYDYLNEENCADLIQRISIEGQKIPAIVRRLHNDPDGYEFEVIAGARRHFAVSHLRNAGARDDILYLVEVRKLTDEEAFRFSDLENRDRQDISDYERGRDYSVALGEYYQGKIKLMAEKIGMARQTLSIYLSVAKLPDVVLRAYGVPTAISVRHAATLSPMLKDPVRSRAVLNAAAEIASKQDAAIKSQHVPQYSGIEVFRLLSAAGQKPKTTRTAKPDKMIVKGEGGQELCTLEKGQKFITIKVPVAKIAHKDALLAALHDAL